MYCLTKITHPYLFQGKYKRDNYFEGWYFKITDSKREHTYAIIPGISLERNDTHAFIQILDMNNKVSNFHYDINEFSYNPAKFEFMIGDNYFSKSRIRLNLNGDGISIQGDLFFCDIIEYPRTAFNPGVMGWFHFVPGMECHHDIISIQHEIKGRLKINGSKAVFNGGKGYIEKDWGSSMPQSWVWFQSNHFGADDVSLSLSIAKIPLMRGSFTGFIVLFRYKERLIMFTTGNGARISELSGNNNVLRIAVKDCRFRLDLRISNSGRGGQIKAPVNGQMSRSITESLDAAVRIRLSDRTGRILYEGAGTNGGLEIVE